VTRSDVTILSAKENQQAYKTPHITQPKNQVTTIHQENVDCGLWHWGTRFWAWNHVMTQPTLTITVKLCKSCISKSRTSICVTSMIASSCYTTTPIPKWPTHFRTN